MDASQWKAHHKFIREVALPAAVRVALAKPMTAAEKRSMKEYERIFNGTPAKK
jgi:hypothetical protein